MTIAELALLITTLSSAVVALINTRANATAIGKLQADLAEATQHQADARRDIILIGESLAQARADNAILAEAFNQIWQEFYQATGTKPKANLEMLRRLQTIEYITGRLKPLNK